MVWISYSNLILVCHYYTCPIWFGFHKSRFEGRHGDADIAAMLENSVPPADLTKVTIFSQHLVQFSKEAGVLSKNNGLFPNSVTVT